MQIQVDLKTLLQQAAQLIKNNAVEQAENLYFQGLNQFHGNEHIYSQLGQLYYNAGKPYHAITFLKLAIEKNSEVDTYHALLSMAFLSVNDKRSALNSLDAAIEIIPDGKHYNNKSFILANMGHMKDSFETLKTAISVGPEYMKDHCERLKWLALRILHNAAVGFPSDQFLKAHEYIQDALAVYQFLAEHGDNNYSAIGHYHAGQLFSVLGDKNSALKYFEKASLKTPCWKAPKFYSEVISRQHDSLKLVSSSEETQTLIVHAGMAHSASTWLQSFFFPNLAGLNHLGVTQFNIVDTEDVVEGHVGFPTHGIELCEALISSDCNHEKNIEILRQLMGNHKVSSISLEAFGYGNNLPIVLERLKHIKNKLNIQIKLLMVIRKQKDVIRANYTHKIKFNAIGWENRKLSDVLNWNAERTNETSIPVWSHDYLKKYQLCEQTFNPQNVMFIPFETLFQKDLKSIIKICQFIGVEQDKEFLKQILVRPPLNITTPEVIKQINLMNPDKDQILDQVHNLFKQSNKELDQVLGLGLMDFGYYDF